MRVWLVVVVSVMLVVSFGLGGWIARQVQPATHDTLPGGAQSTAPGDHTLSQRTFGSPPSESLPGYDPRVLPNFSAFKTVAERKRAFFNFLLPQVRLANQHIMAERKEILALMERKTALTEADRSRLHALARKYRVLFEPEKASFWDELLKRVDVLPPSMVLAQAAIESAWGTSRFAVQGNNLFGIWCFSPGCGLKPLARDTDKSHEVRRYDTVLDSIEDYLLNLNRHSRYAALRDLRASLRKQNQPLSGLKLIEGLHGYSETGQAYIETVASVIRHNRLERFDSQPSLLASEPKAGQG